MAVYKLRNVETGYPYLLLPGIHLVGRSDEADILVDYDPVSRRHAHVHNLDDGVFIEDLGSHNGSWLDETYLEPSVATKMELGEVIYFAGVAFRLDPEGTPQQEAVPPKPSITKERLKRPTEKVDVSIIKNKPQSKSAPIPAEPVAAPAPAPVQVAARSTSTFTPPSSPNGAVKAPAPTVIHMHSPTFEQKAFYAAIGLAVGLLVGIGIGLVF